MSRRIIAGLLVLVLLFTSVPLGALAAQPEEQSTVSADEENGVYVIKNADETVTGLKVGEVFACGEPNRNERNGRCENYIHIYNAPNPAISRSQRFKWNDIFVDNVFPNEENFFHTQYVGLICEFESEALSYREVFTGHTYQLIDNGRRRGPWQRSRGWHCSSWGTALLSYLKPTTAWMV